MTEGEAEVEGEVEAVTPPTHNSTVLQRVQTLVTIHLRPNQLQPPNLPHRLQHRLLPVTILRQTPQLEEINQSAITEEANLEAEAVVEEEAAVEEEAEEEDVLVAWATEEHPEILVLLPDLKTVQTTTEIFPTLLPTTRVTPSTV